MRFSLGGTASFPLVTAIVGDVVATFAPRAGGRLLALTVGDAELLWRDRTRVGDDLRPRQDPSAWRIPAGRQADWVNLGGSKTWLAPQGSGPDRWDGPPDPVIDSGPYRAVIDGGVLTMTSEDDERSGLRITRRFVFDAGAAGFTEHIELRNTGDRLRRWSAWEVCQIPTVSGEQVVAVGAAAHRVVDLGVHEGLVGAVGSPEGAVVAVVTGVGKVGFTDAVALEHRGVDGVGVRLAMVDPGPGDEYPDGGCRTEVWTQRPVEHAIEAVGGLHPRDAYAELEVLGPLVTLEPGAASTCVLEWGILA